MAAKRKTPGYRIGRSLLDPRLKRQVPIKFQREYVCDLRLDPMYARVLNPANVHRIVENFEPAALGAFYVNKRRDGKLIVLNGGHRLEACRQLGRDKEVVDCLIYQGLSVTEEAQLFGAFNAQLMVNQPSIFKAAVIAGDDRATAINKMVLGRGMKITATPGVDGGISAVGGLYKLHEHGVLADTLLAVEKAYPGFEGQGTVPSTLLDAIGELLRRYPAIDIAHLATVLERRPMRRWRNDAREVGRATSTSAKRALMKILVTAYNKNKRVQRLGDPDRVKPTLRTTRERYAEIIRLRREGLSDEAIAESLGMQTYIVRRLAKSGSSRRS